MLKRLSKKLFVDKKPSAGLKVFYTSGLHPYAKIRRSLPDFCSKFLSQELYDVQRFEEATHDEKPFFVKSIFALHLYTLWMTNYVIQTQNLRAEERNEYMNLRAELVHFLGHRHIVEYIVELTETHDNAFSEQEVRNCLQGIEVAQLSKDEVDGMLMERLE
mmetsp:Transcript_47921/g.35132  ORF Transcript_47921/g.35132 Transcript_47921/m.35132 type:complete len:161 (+) Transcript_47921:636-1118(+)